MIALLGLSLTLLATMAAVVVNAGWAALGTFFLVWLVAALALSPLLLAMMIVGGDFEERD